MAIGGIARTSNLVHFLNEEEKDPKLNKGELIIKNDRIENWKT